MLPFMHDPVAAPGAVAPRRAAIALALLAAALALPACGSARRQGPPPPPASPDDPEVRAVAVAEPPAVDGNETDAVWAAAEPVTVPLEGERGPRECAIRALVHEGTLYLLVRWADTTEDRKHRPWVRNDDGTWGEGPEREDALAVAFPMEGPFTANMLAPVECVWDVWHWKAARTDPAGHAMDRVHRNTFADPGGRRRASPLPDGRTLYIARPEDDGTSVTEELPAPASGASGPRFRARKPEGSAASVAARGAWHAGRWTVELARALHSAQPDDRNLHGVGSIPFAVAILDRAEDEAHVASGVLRLLLPPPSPSRW